MRKRHTIDLMAAPYTTYGAGVVKGNPRKCIKCCKSIRHGETWRRDASAKDPDGYGRIVVIQHSPTCPNGRTPTAVLSGQRARIE